MLAGGYFYKGLYWVLIIWKYTSPRRSSFYSHIQPVYWWILWETL